MEPRYVVVVREANADVLAPGHAGEIGETGQRVYRRRIGHELGPWSALAHARHAEIDHSRVDLRDRVMAHPPAIENSDGEVVDHDVGLLAQRAADLDGAGLRHVEGQRTLVPIPHDVVRVIADLARGRVQLDHVGSEVAKDAGGEGPGQDVSEVEYAKTFERARHSSSQPISASTAAVSLPGPVCGRGPRNGVPLRR